MQQQRHGDVRLARVGQNNEQVRSSQEAGGEFHAATADIRREVRPRSLAQWGRHEIEAKRENITRLAAVADGSIRMNEGRGKRRADLCPYVLIVLSIGIATRSTRHLFHKGRTVGPVGCRNEYARRGLVNVASLASTDSQSPKSSPRRLR